MFSPAAALLSLLLAASSPVVAEKPHPEAANLTGHRTQDGQSFADSQAAYGRGDVVSALAICRRLAAEGSADGMMCVGNAYEDGLGVKQDDSVAVLWISRAAEHGDGWAAVQLATRYLSGKGVARDSARALSWYRRAAVSDFARLNPFWITHLGDLLYDGTAVRRDYKEAQQWYRKAAGLGDSGACKQLGLMLLAGQGSRTKPEEGAAWLLKAANETNAPRNVDAPAIVGTLYQQGRGLPRNTREALKWWRLAADRGSGYAMNKLGEAYERGAAVPRNEAESARLFRAAAKANEPRAQLALARHYMDGIGAFPKNPVLAWRWAVTARERFGEVSGHSSRGTYESGAEFSDHSYMIGAAASQFVLDTLRPTMSISQLNLATQLQRQCAETYAAGKCD